jgi:toxin ParE1/3/4
MARFILSEYVEPELTAIWQYIALDNVDAADLFVEPAYNTIQTLAKMPGMGKPWKMSPERLRQLRSFRVKGYENYLIFYGPIPDGIEVFHLIHGARDIDSILGG